METKEKLEFDAKDHIYRFGGVVVPSVTTILAGTGFIDTKWSNDAAMQRGSDVHALCQFYDEGDYSEAEADRLGLKGYVDAYIKFLAETRFEIRDIERPLYHEVLRYAGTPDRVGVMNGNFTVVDLKTGVPARWHGYQLGAYAMLVDPIAHASMFRYSLYLAADGTYKMERFTYKNDAKVFTAALTVFRAQEKE